MGGQSEPTSLRHEMDTYRKRLDSFGFHALVVDGHSVEELCKAFHEASMTKGKPTAILAKTLKGKGFEGIEDQEGFHGKALGDAAAKVIEKIKARMKNTGATEIVPAKQLEDDAPKVNLSGIALSEPPAYKKGEKIATRVAYGSALVKVTRNNNRVVALDSDVKNSTYSDKVKKAFPDNFVECFIAEQNLVGVGIGMGCRGRTVPFVSTFAAFFSRAFDQLRMGAISQTNLNCVGSHAGVSIGEDGPSQMALEDISMFRSIPGSTVFYPSDAVSAERAVELAANTKGICFIRTSRPATAVLYENNHVFTIGKRNLVLSHADDPMLIVGAGITLHEALKAAQDLAAAGINVAVMDPFTVKPIDQEMLIREAARCHGRVLTVEDHYPEGGLGEAVTSALAEQRNVVVKRLAVREVPRSGPPTVLLDHFGISSKAIVEAAKELATL